MDNASKNAGEMISSLTQQFNTKRQGAITNELVDIITGASGETYVLKIDHYSQLCCETAL
jgi:hypothetical protein